LQSLQAVILINFFAYLAVAHLASTLANKLRQTGLELQDKSGELLNLQALYENVIHSIRSGLITTDLDGRITLLNVSGQRLLEKDAPAVYGRDISELFLERLPKLRPGDISAQGEVRGLAPSGEEKTFGITVTALNVADRGTLGYVYTFEDRTEIKRLEREISMHDRLAAVGRLAAGIAHEIRNPLASISGSVSMLSHGSPFSQEQKTLVDIVTRESERLHAIITDFLAYSREKSYKFVRGDLVPLLQDTLTLLENRSQTHGLQIVRKFTPGQAFATVDPDRIKQVFWNLLENAVRAMDQKGTITVSLQPAGDYWRVGVRDTGPGIPPAMIEKIFEPFQSQFEGGTGLGLALVYQIVQAHGARIYVRSTPGKGAEFILEILNARALDRPVQQTAASEVLHG
jgi:two-component system sensor histidine kinase PilS (NtrC family)